MIHEYTLTLKRLIQLLDGVGNGLYIHVDRKAAGTPYVFRKGDFSDLRASKCMFARKFDENTDKEIIEMIYYSLGEQSGK